jgi:hypothetical protein
MERVPYEPCRGLEEVFLRRRPRVIADFLNAFHYPHPVLFPQLEHV